MIFHLRPRLEHVVIVWGERPARLSDGIHRLGLGNVSHVYNHTIGCGSGRIERLFERIVPKVHRVSVATMRDGAVQQPIEWPDLA